MRDNVSIQWAGSKLNRAKRTNSAFPAPLKSFVLSPVYSLEGGVGDGRGAGSSGIR